MSDSFPFVAVSPSESPILGWPDKGLRIYRREGTRDDMAEWFDKVCEVAGQVVSPGGAQIYANVSRAGIYKAINEGRLTAFGFRVTSHSRSVFGFKRKVRELPYLYIPIGECKAWGKIIEAKAKAKTLTIEDNPGYVDERTFRKLEAGPMRAKYPKKKARK